MKHFTLFFGRWNDLKENVTFRLKDLQLAFYQLFKVSDIVSNALNDKMGFTLRKTKEQYLCNQLEIHY